MGEARDESGEAAQAGVGERGERERWREGRRGGLALVRYPSSNESMKPCACDSLIL